jgi:GntR family histidine utilization transcriptional repressor
LASTFQVSRLTVQRAVRELALRGLVTRQRGSGTYVSLQPSQFSLLEVRDMSSEIRARGGTPVRRVLKQAACPAPPDVAEKLHVEPGEEVYHASILSSDKATPIAIVDRWSVTDLFPDFLAQDFTTQTVFSYWAGKTLLDEVELSVVAILPDIQQMNLLDINASDPCIQVHRSNRVAGRAITYTRITFAGGRMELTSRYRPTEQFRPVSS